MKKPVRSLKSDTSPEVHTLGCYFRQKSESHPPRRVYVVVFTRAGDTLSKFADTLEVKPSRIQPLADKVKLANRPFLVLISGMFV